MNSNNIAGASAHYLAQAEVGDEIQKQMADDVGLPSDEFEDGTNVASYQSLPHSHRYYGNNLGGSSGRTGVPQLRQNGGNATKMAAAAGRYPHQSSSSATPAQKSSTAASAHPRQLHPPRNAASTGRKQQRPTAMMPPRTAASTGQKQQRPHGMYSSPIPPQQISVEERFQRRAVGRLATDGQNDPTSMKRKKRVYSELAEDGNNVTKVLLNGFVAHGTPPVGQSQDAAKTLLLTHASPQTTEETTEEKKSSKDGD